MQTYIHIHVQRADRERGRYQGILALSALLKTDTEAPSKSETIIDLFPKGKPLPVKALIHHVIDRNPLHLPNQRLPYMTAHEYIDMY